MRKSKNVAYNVLLYVIFLSVIAMIIGLVIKYTNVKDKVHEIINPTFCIEYNGVTYTGDNNKLTLPLSGQAKFTVKNGGLYTVEVSPNKNEPDFNYTVNGNTYSFHGENLSNTVVKKSNIFSDNFIIDCSERFYVIDVLKTIWGDEEIEAHCTMQYPYLLTVTSADGKTVSFEIVQTLSASEIVTDPDNIIF